jgi:arsenate reductase
VVEAMREVGIDLSQLRPRLLTGELLAGARLLITMGCGEQCPWAPGVEREDWPLEDPKGKEMVTVRRIRSQIADRVKELIAARQLG